MPLLICNDLHLGVKRASGTTLQSQTELGEYLHAEFRKLVMQHTDKHLLINGDLFDAFSIDPMDLIECFNTLSEWLDTSHNCLTLIAGNHDRVPRANKVSSFELLGHVLTSQYGDRVRVVDWDDGFTKIAPNIFAISHMPNQDLFDAEIEKAIASDETGYLLLHCNYCSTFCEHSDHSLNISPEQVRHLKGKWHCILGHEHQGRDLDRVTIVGNQFPSSVSDCMAHGDAQRNGLKRALIIEDDLGRTDVQTWAAAGYFTKADWRNLEDTPHQFIRVEGTASAGEAQDVINTIAAFRNASKAFVITNAVKVEGSPDFDNLTESSFEAVKSFDVLAALLDELSPQEATLVKDLLND